MITLACSRNWEFDGISSIFPSLKEEFIYTCEGNIVFYKKVEEMLGKEELNRASGIIEKKFS